MVSNLSRSTDSFFYLYTLVFGYLSASQGNAIHVQSLAIEMNPKPYLVSKMFHIFKNCEHLKRIEIFLNSFVNHRHFLPKLQILVVKICT